MKQIFFASNQFHGSFPTDALKQLIHLEIFDIEFNQFFGQILSGLTLQPNLTDIIINNNRFSGTFPSVSFITKLVYEMQLGENDFTGTLPTWLCDLPQLLTFNISFNDFSGTFPSCFQNFHQLGTLSIGYNSLTGSIPTNVFSIPQLILVSMPENCFDGGFDESYFCINITQTISVINLNSLHSTKCRNTRGMNGMTVPRCIWEIQGLEGLLLSGNGFRGSIPSDIQMSKTISSLSISHNYFTGSIPSFIQQHAFQYLDLSYNKFIGTVKKVNGSTFPSNGTGTGGGYWNITHNRISGSLSSVFGETENVNMLEGNLFACDWLPSQDPNYSNYFCGSSQLDYASYVLTGTSCLLLFVLVAGMMIFFRSACQTPSKLCTLIYDCYSRYLSVQSLFPTVHSSRMSRYHKVYQFHQTFDLFIRVAVIVFSLVSLILLPSYLIFYQSDRTNYKYDFEYSWVQTSAYLTGIEAAIVLFVLWLIVMLVFLVILFLSHDLTERETLFSRIKDFFKRYAKKEVNSSVADDLKQDVRSNPLHPDLLSNQSSPSYACEEGEGDGSKRSDSFPSMSFISLHTSNQKAKSEVSEVESKGFKGYFVTAFFVFSINVITTFTLNYFYLSLLSASSTTYEVKVSLQIGLAVVKLFWNYCVLNVMIGILKLWEGFSAETYRVRHVLLIWNTILAPCVAALFTDRLCFYEYFFDTSTLNTSVDVSYFNFIDNSTEEYVYQENSIQLPFMYYYTCSSQILTSYIPIFLYTYSFLPFISIGLIAVMSGLNSKYLNKLVLAVIPGIVRPAEYHKFRKFIYAEGIMSSLVLHVNVLMTFGLQSPLLAFAIAVTICLECVLWKVVVNRFVKFGGNDKELIGSETRDFATNLESSTQSKENEEELQVVREGTFEVRPTIKEDEERRLQVLEDTLQDEWCYLYKARWRIFYIAMVFAALIVLDFSGDEIGLSASLLWVGLSVLSVLVIVRLLFMDLAKFLQRILYFYT